MATTLSASDMLMRFADQIPMLMRLTTALAYVMGMYFVIFGIFKLKQFGDARTQMSSEHHLKAPIIYLVVGTLLLYLPGSIQMGMSTFYGAPTPLGYLEESDQWSQFYHACYAAIQLFGVIAFIRGLVMFTHLAGSHGGQPGTLGKAMMHVVGGIFCINIYQFIQVVQFTFGIST